MSPLSAEYPAVAESESRASGDSAGPAGAHSRELSEFLVELSIALHKHAIYPSGHPLLEDAVDAVHRTLLTLLLDRVALSIGIARRQLIIEGVATDSNHPLLADLAGKLHRHHLGAVKFVRGLSRDELGAALSALGLEPLRDATPLGMQLDRQAQWSSVKLFPLTYDRLELLDEGEADAPDARPASPRDGHAAQLWVGLARAAIAADQPGLAPEPAVEPTQALEPETVARAIDEHDREVAYDQVIVGYLLQIAREVRLDGPAEAGGLKRRISKLVGSLQPATLRRLLEMGGDASQRRRFVLDASQGMSVDAVVDLVQAAASAEGQTISHSLVRMLTKLASHASAGAGLRGQAADGAFREHVERLVGSWTLDDPNPVAYSAALEQMSRSDAESTAPAEDADIGARGSHGCEPARVLAMGLELDVWGGRVSHAVAQMLASGALNELLDVLDAAPDPGSATARSIWDRIASEDPLRVLLRRPRVDHALVRRVVLRCGTAAVAPLLEALDADPDPSHQARLLSYLTLLGPDAGDAVAAHLGYAPAPLARELLVCLGKLAPPSAPLEATAYLTHHDPALRREAAKLLLGYDDLRDPTLRTVVRDADERVVHCGLLAAQSSCPPDVAQLIRERIDRGELSDALVRAAAVRAVGAAGTDDSPDWMLRRVLAPTSLFRRQRLAPPTPETLAAISVLAQHWADDPRAAAALGLARRSTSPSLRGAAQRGAASAEGR